MNTKIYTHKGTAEHQIKRGGFYLPTEDPFVISMPSEEVLKKVANGSVYGTVSHKGEYQFSPIDFD